MPDKAAWKCDSCHTNNYDGAAFCRVCQLEPGSATGATEVVVHDERRQEVSSKPTFVPSKHATGPRPTITLTPVPPKRTSPPRRSAPAPSPLKPARPPMSRVTARKLVKITLGIVAFIVLAVTVPRIGALLPDAPTSSQGTSTAKPPCPDAVARWLSGSGTGSVLIAQYDTGQHVVTICRDSGGQYHYDGQMKGTSATSETHIALTASQTATGFQARNANYLYEIDGSDLRLTKSGQPVKSWRLTKLGP
jgi:hypothetical protein